jgi:hypothetical protein
VTWASVVGGISRGPVKDEFWAGDPGKTSRFEQDSLETLLQILRSENLEQEIILDPGAFANFRNSLSFFISKTCGQLPSILKSLSSPQGSCRVGPPDQRLCPPTHTVRLPLSFRSHGVTAQEQKPTKEVTLAQGPRPSPTCHPSLTPDPSLSPQVQPSCCCPERQPL